MVGGAMGKGARGSGDGADGGSLSSPGPGAYSQGTGHLRSAPAASLSGRVAEGRGGGAGPGPGSYDVRGGARGGTVFGKGDRGDGPSDAERHGPGPGVSSVSVSAVRPRAPCASLGGRGVSRREGEAGPGPGSYGVPGGVRDGRGGGAAFGKAVRGEGGGDGWESGRSPGPGQYNVERASRGSGRRAPSAALSGRHGDMGERGGGAGVGFVGVPS